MCALLVKDGLQRVEPDLRYVGFRIPPTFVVGYGLDVAERYRNLPYIARLPGLRLLTHARVASPDGDPSGSWGRRTPR